MEWSNSVEKLLASYCDESCCRERMHRLAFYRYKKMLSLFQIPIICCSALSGSIQFLSSSFPAAKAHIITGTASLSIITSLLSAVMSYLKLGTSMSAHEQALNKWQSFFNHIKHQLSLSRSQREEADQFMQWVKTEYQQLFELSPIISQKFINQTKKKIKKHVDNGFKVPNYCNGMHATHAYESDSETMFEENTQTNLEIV